jgi:hypothetical protein
MNLLSTICNAIRERRVIDVVYDGHTRTVEPHIVWQTKDDDYVLDGWQIGGHSDSDTDPPWRRFPFAKIESAALRDETFSGHRSIYNPHSDRYTDIYCRL